ncbi:S-adenosyl-L-methionine-dependent methyltransferase [Stipitochalara longipes BDJ]|nr:S-adenosyl-L-methionine-dependent methyltransferase [Stipitochalara longipes BDJ]
MPRLPHSLLLHAYKKSPLLPLILRGTRDLPSAINELRWLTEHVQASNPPCPRFARKRLLHLCKRRSRAEPLQYILGSQPFGELDIKCRPGVLIPRPETEAYTSHLASLLINGELDEQISLDSKKAAPSLRNEAERRRELRILDICSGSGCISLLLHSLLSESGKFPQIKTLGLDISPKAIALANENLALAIRNKHVPSFLPNHSQDVHLNRALHTSSFRQRHLKGHSLLKHLAALKKKQAKEKTSNLHLSGNGQPVHFAQHDIFSPLPKWVADVDIIISNPPYISRSSFASETSHSVRKYEPRLALVPDRHGYGVERSNRIARYLTREGKSVDEEVQSVQESDIFYRQLLRIYEWRASKVLVMEIGDEEQAVRVVELALVRNRVAQTNRIEIWRDWPGQESQRGEERPVVVEGRVILVRGAGKMRSVVLFRTPEVREEKMRTKDVEGKTLDLLEQGFWNSERECFEVKESMRSIWDEKKRRGMERRGAKRLRKKERKRAREGKSEAESKGDVE